MTTTMATVRSMATMATGDDDDDGDDDDGATTTDDVGDGGMGATTGYDDNDAFDGCGVFQWRRRRTKARWRGQREIVLSVLAASDPLLDFGEKGGRKVI